MGTILFLPNIYCFFSSYVSICNLLQRYRVSFLIVKSLCRWRAGMLYRNCSTNLKGKKKWSILLILAKNVSPMLCTWNSWIAFAARDSRRVCIGACSSVVDGWVCGERSKYLDLLSCNTNSLQRNSSYQINVIISFNAQKEAKKISVIISSSLFFHPLSTNHLVLEIILATSLNLLVLMCRTLLFNQWILCEYQMLLHFG